jgi:hypothetical protein
MNVGEIYYFISTQAAGHNLRPKYHIYLGELGWRLDGQAFLFINKNNFDNDYPLKKSDYDFFPLEVSFVSGVVSYSASELAAANPVKKGVLSKKHLQGLHDAIAASNTMEGYAINLVCKALRAALQD